MRLAGTASPHPCPLCHLRPICPIIVEGKDGAAAVSRISIATAPAGAVGTGERHDFQDFPGLLRCFFCQDYMILGFF